MTIFSDVPNTDVIHTVMQDILDAIIAVYQAEDVALPDRHVLSVGVTPHDCEQVNVSFEQLYIGGPGDEADQPMRCDAPRTVGLTVQIVRCIPVPKARGAAPEPAAMGLSTLQLTADAWLLLEGIMASGAADYLGALADISIAAPSGGYQAIQASVVVGVP